jgi:hypothetical protein
MCLFLRRRCSLCAHDMACDTGRRACVLRVPICNTHCHCPHCHCPHCHASVADREGNACGAAGTQREKDTPPCKTAHCLGYTHLTGRGRHTAREGHPQQAGVVQVLYTGGGALPVHTPSTLAAGP